MLTRPDSLDSRMKAKRHTTTVRLGTRHRDMLQELSDALGVAHADVIRRALEALAERVTIVAPTGAGEA